MMGEDEAESEDPLAFILARNHSLQEVISRPEHEIQVRYTRVLRDGEGRPHFNVYEYGVDPGRYFYPASTVKLPAVLVALEALREAVGTGVTSDSEMWVDRGLEAQSASVPRNGGPSLHHSLREIFLVSDNEAYNRVYGFVGRDTINGTLQQKGYRGVRIFHRLGTRRDEREDRATHSVSFIKDGRKVFETRSKESTAEYFSPRPILKGRGYMKNGVLVESPKDFSNLNEFPLRAQQRMLQALIFPESVDATARFAISHEDRHRVLLAMGQHPGESRSPRYNPGRYPDSYAKFLMFGGRERKIPEHVRLLGKSGMAYGYLSDNAYVVDFKNKIEFLLAAVIHVNANQVYNDDHYEYQTVGLPFLRDLGQAVYEWERRRPRKHAPDLTALERLFVPR